jgi:pimeloyl-ACP methyl ester carboxylesterase
MADANNTAGSPTVVLVHGAFADASRWNGVIERRQAKGVQVMAAANPLPGISIDSAYIAGVLEERPGPVVDAFAVTPADRGDGCDGSHAAARSELGFSEPSGPTAWKELPSWAVVATGDKAVGADVVHSQAERIGATITEIEGSHVIMISQPQAVTDVILEAVAAVG